MKLRPLQLIKHACLLILITLIDKVVQDNDFNITLNVGYTLSADLSMMSYLLTFSVAFSISSYREDIGELRAHLPLR